ncbi:LAQU0S01e07250g1_1 [Lachancea quebecensis]|uniref:rRNA methyltransferase 1, mitochondrial n=1 Tax=Lachancea quebecensis TaxID=1654605 RepID=A0A0P1KM81_9SACH|nr:LAQU0S01e07250g1_1 [Lachancea quebecensis]
MFKPRCNTILRRSLAHAIRPAVKVPNRSHQGSGPSNVDKNLPFERRTKAWEKAGEDKDSWFRRKYAHVHARTGNTNRQKEKTTQNAEGTSVQHDQHKSKFRNRNMTGSLRANPLMEYVHGTNSVLSALQADKRDYYSRVLYHAFVTDEIRSLAKKRGAQLEMTDKHRLNLLTNYAVHNNVVLETKPLQLPEISQVGACDPEGCTFAYDELFFDDTSERRMSFIQKENKKFPLGLYLDEVSDPHNMGAIIRSAYFLGVDFMVMSRRNCAPLSPTVSKTSSGATELLPIFTVDKPLDFFSKSQKEGWTFVSAGVSKQNKFAKNKKIEAQDLHGMLKELPVILVVGNEGEGVRTNLQMRSDFLVEIPQGREAAGTWSVDSLNVSVATAILLNSILN